jgi:TM2 domain-containing membrane protein YozV
MKQIKLFILPFILLGGLVLTTSAVVIPEKKSNGIDKDRLAKAELLIQSSIADGSDISYKEMLKIGKVVKGSKLSFKQRLVLKTFRKKISTAMISANAKGSSGKSQLIALLLCIFVGVLGIHRFYLGYTWQGIVQLLTLGVFGIWTLIDLIRIITGDLKPKDGDYETEL